MNENRKSASEDYSTQLFITEEKDYGDKYKLHLLEQYKLCVEMADKISSRRCTSNNFFLSLNTLLLAAIGILSELGPSLATLNWWWVIIAAIAGILFCWTWEVTIRCYRDLNSAKFKIINAIEQKLPAAPFNWEWKILNPEDKKYKYPELTRVERWVPRVFISLYVILILIVIVSFALMLVPSRAC